MADKIIIEVGLENGDYGKKAEETIKKIQELKDQQTVLTATGKKNSLEFEQNKIKLQQLGRELKANTLLSQEYDDSLNGLKANLSLLTAQYNSLSKEQRENSEEGKALAKEILNVTDKLKEQEGAVGNFRRNVGNYKSALEDLKTELASQILSYNKLTESEKKNSEAGKELQKQIEQTKSQIKETSTELAKYEAANVEAAAAADEFSEYTEVSSKTNSVFKEGLKSTISELVPFGGELVAAAEKAKDLSGGILTGNSALKIFKTALISTGIGAFVVIVASLLSYLSKFDPVIDLFQKAFAGISSAINTASGIVVDFFRNLKSFGDFASKIKGILSDPIGSFKSLGKEMANAAKEAYNLKKAQQDLEDQMKIQEVQNAKAEQQIAQLILQSKNRSLSEKERTKLLQEAAKIDQDNFNKRTKLANEELRQAEQAIAIKARLSKQDIERLKREGLEYAFVLKDRANITDEEVDKLRDAELSRTNILKESTNRQEKIQNQQDALAEKAAAKEEAAAKKRQEAAEKSKEADEERLQSLVRTNQTILTERQKELDSINAEIDEKVAKYKKYGRTTEQLEKERIARLKELRDEFQKDDLAAIEDNIRQIQDLQVNSIKDAGQRELAQIQLNNSRRLSEQDKVISDLKDRASKGEKGITNLIASEEAVRAAIVEDNARLKNQKLDDIDLERLKKYQENQQALAEANVDNATTDADRFIALQEQLDLEYEIRIENAVRLGEDTFAIHEQFKAKQRELDDATNKAAIDGINQFGDSFQEVVGKNTDAARIAGSIQSKINAGIQLQNNILIIQENLRALAAQGKLLFPANIIAIASTLAALGSAVGAAKKLAKFQDGGVFESDGKGAVLAGYSRTDNTNAMLRSGEAIIVAEAVRDPKALGMLSAINTAYGGRPLVGPGSSGYKSSYPAFADGGIFGGSNYLTQAIVDSKEIAAAIAQEFVKLPAPVVDVRDVTSAQENRTIAVTNGNY